MKIRVYRDLMGANDQWARRSRALLEKHGVRLLNLIGSPGAGKTALLEQTVKRLSRRLYVGHLLSPRRSSPYEVSPRADLRRSLGARGRPTRSGKGGAPPFDRLKALSGVEGQAAALQKALKFPTIKLAVLEGDIETKNDAERLAKLKCRVSQLLTGGACHLEAKMVHHALRDLPLAKLELVIVENVGNLVCPAEFDIGEHAKVVVLSVTEGEDKPLKYPTIFRESSAVVVTKTDLLPHVPFKLKKCLANIRLMNPRLRVFQVSAVTGLGINEWIEWLTSISSERHAG